MSIKNEILAEKNLSITECEPIAPHTKSSLEPELSLKDNRMTGNAKALFYIQSQRNL